MENLNSMNDDEININHLFKNLKRNKALIIFIIFISTLITTFYSFTTKPIWIGRFNIVVKDQNKKSSLVSNSLLDIIPLSMIGGAKDSNETQILILKSPSVLMPVYNFVKNYNIKGGRDTYSISFKEWLASYLTIDFENDSSVLKVEYKSDDKKLIMETLEKISNKYRDYSKSDKEKEINTTIDYLKIQTKLMEERYLISQKKFNKFTVKNGLGNIDGFVGLGANKNEFNNLNLINSSPSKVQTKYNSGIGQMSQSAGQRFNNQFNMLEQYEAKYVDLSANLKPNSKTLSELKTKIDNLKSSLRRPNEILLNYKQLLNEAQRDEMILNELKNTLEVFKLEKIKSPDAWELISVPTIDNKPFSPNKKNIFFLTLISSLIIGSTIVQVKCIIIGKIFELEEFQKLLPYSYLDTLIKNNQELNTRIIKHILNIKDKKDLIGIIYLSKSFFSNFKNTNESLFSTKDLNALYLTEKNIEQVCDCKKIIVLANAGLATGKEIIFINKYLSVYKDKITGWFFIDEDKKMELFIN